MLYAETQNWLGWPQRKQVFEPEGAGARVAAEVVQKKIGSTLSLAYPDVKLDVGVLTPDSDSDSTEIPLAVICEFRHGVGDQELHLAHRLAWNFSRTALLITLEPHRLIAWSCYQDPLVTDEQRRVCELRTPSGFRLSGTPEQRKVRDLLHWVSLITNRVQREVPAKFRPEGRADALLLKNLRHVRSELLGMGLSTEFCHALLARVIFTQFLFHRKDRDGNPFFTPRLLRRLNEEGTLSCIHTDLASILAKKRDTYALFSWMDEHFNGDLFPAKQADDLASRETAWRAERAAVTKEHLTLLMELVSGQLDTTDRQLNLWPVYSFDAIPLEFISSVYEQFLSEERSREKAYYTPTHLVDYVLDAVLPWNDPNWDVRILDPCCGSGVFLVKAFQRVIYRWVIDQKREPLVSDLKPILASNFVGIDKNPEAARVASFSLYLAMADAIEPKHYVTRTGTKVFPPLRGTRIFAEDFFDESTPAFRSKEDANRYDLVIGNAPWGDNSIRASSDRLRAAQTKAQAWAKLNGWPVSNNDIGSVFLAKAALLLKESGRVAMIQSGSLLLQRGGPAAALRKKLFTTYSFNEITNLSALRRSLFSTAIGPACVVVFSRTPCPGATQFSYIAPKSADRQREETILIEPYDVSLISHQEAATDPYVWSVLALGGMRDLQVVRKLLRFPNLELLEAQEKVISKLGIIPGNGRQNLHALRNIPFFADSTLPVESFLCLDARGCPPWSKPRVASTYATNPEAFRSPQLLVKLAPLAASGRLRAVRVVSGNKEWGVVCKKTFLSVRDYSTTAQHIDRACIAYNSNVAAYFLRLTSGRGLYNTEMLLKELRSMPIPDVNVDIASFKSFDDVDAFACRAYGLTSADETLIQDFLEYTLPDVLRKTGVSGRRPTTRIGITEPEPELSAYTRTFARVVKATFGADKTVEATICTEPDGSNLSVRMLTLKLSVNGSESINVEPIEADGLLDLLSDFHKGQLESHAGSGTGARLGFQRVGFLFHTGQEAGVRSTSLTIVKPDERRYWTRSMAMRDADQLTGAILNAAQQGRPK